MKDGIININKPQGMTSNDVIYRMRRILGIKKLGHTGTLDPLATGVLPVCINKATRVAEYMDVDFKTYRCKLLLGTVTDSQDITGEVLASAHRDEGEKTEKDWILTEALSKVDENKVIEAFSAFKGLMEQLPPLHSAVRIEGRRLYEYAHGGSPEERAEIEKKVKSRQIYIENLSIEEIDLPYVTFKVKCSKGTYIRTICQDVGDSLGCGAAMLTLERTESGAFTIENSVSLEELSNIAVAEGILDENLNSIDRTFHEDIPACFEKYVLGTDFPLIHFGTALVNEEQGRRFIDGWHISYGDCRILQEPSYSLPVEKSLLRGADPEAEGYNQGSYAGLKVKPEYAGAYKLYIEDKDKPDSVNALNFLGVAFHSPKYKKLVADKVFYRTK